MKDEKAKMCSQLGRFEKPRDFFFDENWINTKGMIFLTLKDRYKRFIASLPMEHQPDPGYFH